VNPSIPVYEIEFVLTMELILNLMWAGFSVLLIAIWFRAAANSTSVSRKVQIFALMMVVLFLLPAISMSDDLIAAQGPAETDNSLRRVADSDYGHHIPHPVSFALPEQVITSLSVIGHSQEAALTECACLPASFRTSALDCRPPPQA
jgi:hypothetical protein